MNSPYFLKMIRNLRVHEEVMLYGNILSIGEDESKAVIDFLAQEYQAEALNYPYAAPAFSPDAAAWGAKTIYIAAQLILYRENKAEDLASLLPDFAGVKDASAILSADLCLRFLPDMLVQLKLIDQEDALAPVLENTLSHWHYSGISYALDINKLDFSVLGESPCLNQLYVNRIIRHRKIALAKHPACRDLVQANLGMFAKELWNDFKIETSIV